jgi:Ca2+-binding RTX toxin-like protein
MSLRPGHQRVIATVVVLLAIGVCATKLHAAVTGHDSAPPNLQTLTSGSMSVSNSADGSAIFAASNMAPGVTDQGEVSIGNTGAAPGTLVLSSFDRSDSPGTYGGVLSERLDVRIEDVSSGANSVVYADKLASMPEQQLGTLAPGKSRTYRFTVSMPDGGAPTAPWTGDNLYQRATASLSYEWTLTETEPVVPTPEPDPGRAPTPPASQPQRNQPCITMLNGNSRGNTLVGTLGGDMISGGRGSDIIVAESGDDCASGNSGADTINGDGGNDRLWGGAGPDRIYGGAGSDTIFTRDHSRDLVNCGSGVDVAFVDHLDSTRNCETVRR